MFGIGGFELFIILLFGFLIFGPEKLPEIARTVGRGIARFKQAQDEMNSVIKSTDIYDPNSDEPFKDPMQALDKLAKHQEAKKKSQSKAESAEPAAEKPAAEKAAGGTTSADGDAKAGTDASPQPPRQESFTERKARYERERAARKAAEQEAAEKAASEAGEAAGKPGAQSGKDAQPVKAEEPASSQNEAACEAAAQGGER